MGQTVAVLISLTGIDAGPDANVVAVRTGADAGADVTACIKRHGIPAGPFPAAQQLPF